MKRFVHYLPFCRIVGIRLNDWSFLALLAFTEKCEWIGDGGHYTIPLSTRKYNLWPQFGFRIFPVRPEGFDNSTNGGIKRL